MRSGRPAGILAPAGPLRIRDGRRRNRSLAPFTRAALAYLIGLAAAASIGARAADDSGQVTDIGSRRELFVDAALVGTLSGGAELRLHHPQVREAVCVFDKPWEGSGSGTPSIFRDGPLYRMYYRGQQVTVKPDTVEFEGHETYLCYAESDDGIHWRRPNLGLYEFRGSKDNNIVFVGGKIGNLDIGIGAAAVFKDDNPDVPPEARYKAVAWSNRPKGFLAIQSPDGIHWSPFGDAPLMTKGVGASVNLAFWDPVRREYRAYWRYHVPLGDYARYLASPPEENVKAPPRQTRRDVRTATSRDFVHWSPPADLVYVDSPPEEIYTNGVKPYFRAPQIFIGFPMRYIERGWSESLRALPDPENRRMRSNSDERFGTAITEGLLMASHDGVTFKRWNEAFLRPGPERTGTWNYGNQNIGWQMVETRSDLAGAPDEISIYAQEGQWTGTSSALRRYTIRMDGFVSVQAPLSGGEVVTKPIRFTGSELHLNFSTSAAGAIRVEIQDAAGNPIPGFALAECEPMFGDTLDRRVTWTSKADLRLLAGRTVRLRLSVSDADVFSFKFEDHD